MKTTTNYKPTIVLFFLFSINAIFAQKDLLVKKDSTELRITLLKETSKKYKYTFLNSENNIKKASILKTLVDTVYIDKFPLDTIVSKVETSKEVKKKELTIAEKDTVKCFIFTFGIGLNLENVLEYNTPNKPDKKIFSATTAIDLGINYLKESSRFAMTNEFHWTAGIQKEGTTGSDKIIRTSDELLTLHDYSITLSKNSNWNFNLIAKTATSLFTIYDGDYFKDYNEVGKNQAFLSPYDLTLSPGIKYQPNKNFRVSISPFSINMYGLLSQSIANTGYYTHTFDDNNEYDLYIFTKQGADLNIWYDKKVKNWLEMQYRLGVSSDYFSKETIIGILDGLFITKIKLFKNLSLAHRAVLRGDFVTQPFKPYYKQNILLSFSKSF